MIVIIKRMIMIIDKNAKCIFESMTKRTFGVHQRNKFCDNALKILLDLLTLSWRHTNIRSKKIILLCSFFYKVGNRFADMFQE